MATSGVIQCRCAYGDLWSEDGVPCVYKSLADAVHAGNEFLSDACAAGLDYSDGDVEVIHNDHVITLGEARQQVVELALHNAAEALDSIANDGDYAAEDLVNLAADCRAAMRSQSC